MGDKTKTRENKENGITRNAGIPVTTRTLQSASEEHI